MNESPNSMSVMRQKFIEATITSLKNVREFRFYQTERGYHGRFYCALQNELDRSGFLPSDCIVEMEYQKSRIHNVNNIRPDIVVHIPRGSNSSDVRENNFAVYELKHMATPRAATDDYAHLDEMFSQLNYQYAFFVNIDSDNHFLENYGGSYRERIHACAVKLENNQISINYGYYKHDEIQQVSETVRIG